MLKTIALRSLTSITARSLKTSSISRSVQAAVSAEKLTIPVPEGSEKPPNPKLDNIVNQIASLNLLEVSELSGLLKKKLNLPETAMMPMGGFAQFAGMQPSSPAAEEEEAPKAVKSSFRVKMTAFDEKQ
jgi:large subunit ribosomal protein L7/L12